jgi:hypothetical protein
MKHQEIEECIVLKLPKLIGEVQEECEVVRFSLKPDELEAPSRTGPSLVNKPLHRQ